MAPAATAETQSALTALGGDLSRMAAFVENQLSGALTAFERRDLGFAEKLIDGDRRVDDFDRDIETRVMTMLADGPLSALALRDVMTVMKMTGEMERVGDLAKNIAKRTLVVSREQKAGPTTGVARLGRACLRQFSDILDAYQERDLPAAHAVWGSDDELDELYNSVFRDIMTTMMEDPGTVNACTHLGFIAKNFERVGDHATNIAEAIHFLMTGEPLIDERPKGDETSTTVIKPPRTSA